MNTNKEISNAIDNNAPEYLGRGLEIDTVATEIYNLANDFEMTGAELTEILEAARPFDALYSDDTADAGTAPEPF